MEIAMKVSKIVSRVMLAVSAMMFAQVGLAADVKTLIEMNGGKPTPGLAKEFSKVKDGEYVFTLDTTKEVKKGVPVSAGAVKNSLEAKLGTTQGVKVSDKGGGKVSVTYTGDEAKFLEQVSKTKIREGAVELALESSVSEGGIRAKKVDRPAADGEVKITISKIEKGVITGKVSDSKAANVKKGVKVSLKADGAKWKKNDQLFFIPEKEEGGVWMPKAGSVK
jgi:hypothetical protein